MWRLIDSNLGTLAQNYVWYSGYSALRTQRNPFRNPRPRERRVECAPPKQLPWSKSTCFTERFSEGAVFSWRFIWRQHITLRNVKIFHTAHTIHLTNCTSPNAPRPMTLMHVKSSLHRRERLICFDGSTSAKSIPHAQATVSDFTSCTTCSNHNRVKEHIVVERNWISRGKYALITTRELHCQTKFESKDWTNEKTYIRHTHIVPRNFERSCSSSGSVNRSPAPALIRNPAQEEGDGYQHKPWFQANSRLCQYKKYKKMQILQICWCWRQTEWQLELVERRSVDH